LKDIKEKIIRICGNLGIDQVGIAPAGPYYGLEPVLVSRIKEGKYTGFEEKDIEKRIDPHKTVADANSVIVCLFPYFTGFKENSNLSVHAYSIDYHKIVMHMLETLGNEIKKELPGFKYVPFIDNGPLVDRYLAHLAGLGFYGINNCIINDKYGSYVFIGYLINNYPLEPDKPDNRTCARCGACIRACPGCAILGNFDFNPLRCVSFITQKKGDLSERQWEILKKHNKAYGCDVCQMVCPHNMHVRKTPIKEFTEDLIFNLDPDEILAMSDREFRTKYTDRTFAWRGRKTLARNLITIRME